jgi:hypothetical protein
MWKKFYNTDTCVLYFKHMIRVSDDHKWRLYYKCVVALAFAMVLNYTIWDMLQNVASLNDKSRAVFMNICL